MSRIKDMFRAVVMGLSLTLLHSGAMAAELSGHLVISGSDTVEPLVNELAKGFMNTYRGVKVVVRGGGSNKGVADTRSGGASIGMVSRALTSQESVDLRAYTIALDGLCFITSKKNPVQNLTPAQLGDIFLGKTGNWKDVGGNNLPINPLIRDRASSSNKVIAEFLEVRESDLKGKVVIDAELGIRLAATDPKALVYVSAGESFHQKLGGMPINILSISGIKPTMKSIAQNSYPLTRPLSLVTKGDPSPLAKAFIAYCQSKAAAPSVRALNYVMPE
jgi:phosphate transport system substrate-binding protein